MNIDNEKGKKCRLIFQILNDLYGKYLFMPLLGCSTIALKWVTYTFKFMDKESCYPTTNNRSKVVNTYGTLLEFWIVWGQHDALLKKHINNKWNIKK